MWTLYATAKATATRPSKLIGIGDRWAALQFDNAVSLVGTVIENASQEMKKTGPDKKPEWKAKYTMNQLLDPDFRLPRENTYSSNLSLLRGVEGLKFDEVH